MSRVESVDQDALAAVEFEQKLRMCQALFELLAVKGMLTTNHERTKGRHYQ